MMPQPMEHRLVCLLLLWITILSICQMAFITFFFTAVYPGSFQNISDVPVADSRTDTCNNMQSCIKGNMVSLEAIPGTTSDTIKWNVDKGDSKLLSAGEKLTLQQDGYYFLLLQVKLNLSREQQNTSNYTIKLSKKNNVLLEVTVNTKLSMSTGAMGKMVFARAPDFLTVTISPPAQVDSNSQFTHLGVLYLPQQNNK